LKLNEITSERVRAWMDENAAQRPTFTNNAFRKLRAFFNWCNDDEQTRFKGLVDPNVCSRRIARDLPKAKPKTGSLQREQLALWFTEVRKLSSPVVANYLQILLLTGARREELATLTWDHVDLRWGSMVIRDKVEGERQIPITPYVAQLLRELKAINETPPAPVRILHGRKIEVDVDNWQPSPWVFFSKTSEDGRMVEPRIGHNRALKAAGLPPLTLHDLRRSFSNLSEWVETPVGVCAQIMGHKPSATAEKHYKPRPLDLLRMWHTKIEAWILEQAGIEQPQAEQKGPRAVPSTTAA
jgi:integrase